jgi:HSP20 family molecular chaperone IbpA
MSLLPFENFWGGSTRPYYRRTYWPVASYTDPFSVGTSLINDALSDTLGDMRRVERQMGELMPRLEDGSYRFRCNVAGYMPEELKVDLEGNQLVLSGEHKQEDGDQSVHRTFVRRTLLPEDVLKDSIQCHIDQRGRLEITAQRQQQAGIEGKKSIPIGFKQSPADQQQQRSVEDGSAQNAKKNTK